MKNNQVMTLTVIKLSYTIDAKPGNFPHQTQTNQDFWVCLKANFTFNNVKFRNTYQDEKSGMDMLKHSTRGSLGLLTYDSTTRMHPYKIEKCSIYET